MGWAEKWEDKAMEMKSDCSEQTANPVQFFLQALGHERRSSQQKECSTWQEGFRATGQREKLFQNIWTKIGLLIFLSRKQSVWAESGSLFHMDIGSAQQDNATKNSKFVISAFWKKESYEESQRAFTAVTYSMLSLWDQEMLACFQSGLGGVLDLLQGAEVNWTWVQFAVSLLGCLCRRIGRKTWNITSPFIGLACHVSI